MPLIDQVVLVTGCSSGIGRALAVELAKRGHRVYASARDVASLESLEGVRRVRLDVTDEASIAAAVGEIVGREGRIDVLVNNAGINSFGPLAELPLVEVRRMLETNVTGLVATTQAVFPHMADRRRGRIVNVGSVVGRLPTPFAGAYCASKSAVHQLSEVLRMELAPFGIDVVVVQPGRVRSSIAETGSKQLERYAAETSRFRAVYGGIKARAFASQERPMETEHFVRVVVDGVLADRAPRTLVAGGGASTYVALSRLPSAVLERAMERKFGLGALR